MGYFLTLGGFLLVLVAMIQYFMTIAKETVSEDVRPYVALFGGGAVISVIGAFLAPGAGTIILAALAVATGGFLIWLLGQRQVPDGELIVRVGEILPPLAALNQEGELVDIADLRGQRVLLKIFRGSW
jgi:hypothetical protein